MGLRSAIVAILLTLPLVHANAPPTALADAPSESVLGEPLTFTDLSVDPDGVIVRSEWEFSDGRTIVGRSVTRALGYAGPHTITLRVTDDAGATSATEVLVVVHAPRMHGRAYALASSTGAIADTGDVATEEPSTRAAPMGEARHGQLRLAGLDAEMRTVENRAIARASVGHVYVPLPIGYLLLTGVESEALATCDGMARAAKFTQVRLNDAPLVPPGEVAPNTRVPIPGGGMLVLNAQDVSAPDRLGVTAARLLLPGEAPIEVAHAEAGVTHCPYDS